MKPLAYNASKTAFNLFTVMLTHELKDTTIKVNSTDPGFTAPTSKGIAVIEQSNKEPP